jgi:membrane associated rhomboid family serine protease
MPDHVDEPDTELDWRCYRHPDREAGVRCTRCERAICPSCMISAPVGFQCPECVRNAPPVRQMRFRPTGPTWASVTGALVIVNLVVYVVSQSSNRLYLDGVLFGPAVASGEWYRLITAGFLHANLIHVGFNCLVLWQLGGLVEPALGRLRFGLVYLTALLAGSLGALIVTPDALTVGASGAVYGLMGVAFITMQRRGIDPMRSGIGSLLLINLLITFVVPGISIGGHIGGLLGGGLAGWLLHELDGPRHIAGEVAVAALAVALVGASLAVVG